MFHSVARLLESVKLRSNRPVARRKPQRVHLCLEALEDRMVLDAYSFTGLGGDTSWFNPLNWADATKGGAPGVPGAADDATIGPGGFTVVVGGGLGAEINNLTTASDCTFIVAGGSPQPSELKIYNSAGFGGPVTDAGRIIANSSSPSGTGVTFGGGATIGPGDLNGNLDAGPNSFFAFTSPSTFAAGATIGPGTGNIIISAFVFVAGTLQNNTANLVIPMGGLLGGGGSVVNYGTVTWTGGTIALTGGIDNHGDFASSGSSPLTLSTTLTNESTFCHLDGTGGLSLTGGGGSIDNLSGIMTVSQPTITNGTGGTGGITNSALGTFEVTAPSSTPAIVSVPFTNEGYLQVDSGDNLILTTPLSPTGTPLIDLDGTLQISGLLTLLSTATSSTGFTLSALPGFFDIGSTMGGPGIPAGPGTLIVPGGVLDLVKGNLEVTSVGTLTGGGEVENAGRLQLDSGAATGFGSYQQDSSGTLALELPSSGGPPTPLTVTGNAQLAGNLVLMGPAPPVGTTYTVVKAGSIARHFDTIPNGMVETDGPTAVTVTQAQPPA